MAACTRSHGEDWAITEAGIEYRPGSQVVLDEAEFPEATERSGMTGPSDLNGWAPALPEGADPAEWQHVLWRRLCHFPVRRGPARAQPVRFACKTLPEPRRRTGSAWLLSYEPLPHLRLPTRAAIPAASALFRGGA